ncbi:MAG: hydroxymethylbilane synthase [Chromatiales bacterium]|nr:hydroxymethylbilane synthase [Chromatiales bacterium]
MQRLRLGTRGSLLALAQSRLVASALQRLHPGLQVDLVTVSTRGDRNLAVPLQDVRDPDFFSAELDEALLAGEVDFCVHSLKDLPADRHAGIVLAALPPRDNPRDVIVWRRDIPARLAAGEGLRVGSSSLRRQGNVADVLAWALPATGRPPVVTFVPVRGAVDARLARLHVPRGAPEALDGVVLALAGLARLWNDPAGRQVIGPLLGDTRWMVLPLTKCPSAAGQGVLAVECRAGDGGTLDLLRGLHDPETAELVAMEEAALAGSEAADRQALGVTAIRHGELGPMCFVRGATPAGMIERLDWNRPPAPRGAIGFDGIAWQKACTRQPAGPLPQLAQLGLDAAVFAAYWHALQHHAIPADARLWVSGAESWRQLAARGHWVEGCGDNLGFDAVRATLECPVLRLPPLQEWTALTYRWAVPGWRESGIGDVIATYDILPPADAGVLRGLRESAARATHFYWSSAEQFHGLRASLPAGARHACGAGKTLRALRAAGADAQPFPNGREWQRWLHG